MTAPPTASACRPSWTRNRGRGDEETGRRAGRTRFALDPAEWMYNPIGSVPGGRALATAEGRLTVEATGKLIAHATTGCVLIG